MKQPATKLKAIVKAHKNQKRGLLEYLMLVSRGVSKDTLFAAGIKDPLKIVWFLRQDGWNIEATCLRNKNKNKVDTFFHLTPVTED